MSLVRGIVHVHSDFSFDCATPLADVKALARAKGLSFVVQTEHSNEMTAASHRRFVEEARALRDDAFLMMPAVEYATADNKVHVLALGVEPFWEDLRLCPPDRLGELIDRIRDAGGVSVLAHPERADAIERVPPPVLDRIDAVEVWNGKTDRVGPSPRAVLEVIRRRRAGAPAPALVGLDLHRVDDYRPVGIRVERMPSSERDLVEMIRGFRYDVFVGPLAWNASACGSGAVAAGRASKAALDLARAVKRRVRR